MTAIPIFSLDDERVAVYRDLPRSKQARARGRFIAEGRAVVSRLLASTLQTDSVLTERRYVDELLPRVSANVPLYFVEDGTVEQLIGFNFHRGVLACGIRPAAKSLGELAHTLPQPLTAVVCVDICDPENIGGILRNCAAFGVDLVLLNENCTDPYARRVVRTSMGAVFQLPLIESRNLREDLSCLRSHGVELIATVLDPTAESLTMASARGSYALLLGNEGNGLRGDTLEQSDRRVTLPMLKGTDSLNVAVASGVFLYHFRHATNTGSH